MKEWKVTFKVLFSNRTEPTTHYQEFLYFDTVLLFISNIKNDPNQHLLEFKVERIYQKEVNTMKTQEYLVTLVNKETLETIDMFYINAYDLTNAKEIASDLTHEYDNIPYFEILAIVENA